jgi:glycosyltransferase involved in cell wall biosynthesis
MEAMAWRIPVITTNILGLPELVQDGESGLLVEPERPDQLAAAIERLHEDSELRDRLVEGGVDRVRGEFNIEVSAQRLATLFDA